EEREQVAAVAAAPREAKQGEERRTKRSLAEPEPLLDREGDAERRECRVERAPPALDRLAHDADRLRRRSGSDEGRDFVGDELERAANAASLEEAHRPVRGDHVA